MWSGLADPGDPVSSHVLVWGRSVQTPCRWHYRHCKTWYKGSIWRTIVISYLSSVGTTIGLQSGCRSALSRVWPSSEQHFRMESLKPLTQHHCLVMVSYSYHMVYLVVGVDVMSWSVNCPHCMTIMVNWVVSCLSSRWILALILRGLGKGPLECDLLNALIPSLMKRKITYN